MRTDLEIVALKRELAMYVAAGNTERAAQVRADLAATGETTEAAVPAETTERAVQAKPAPKRR